MRNSPRNPAFTLIELLVVIAIVGILTAISVSGMLDLFASGLEAEARNTIDAQLKAARSLAVRNRLYTGVRFARRYNDQSEYWLAIVQEDADAPGRLEGTTFGSDPNHPLVYNTENPNPAQRFFAPVEGIVPVRLPKGLGVGRDTEYAGGWTMDRFTTFTVMFGPDGRLVRQWQELAPRYVVYNAPDYLCGQLFSDTKASTDAQNLDWKVWDPTLDEHGAYVLAVRVFDALAFAALPDAGKENYLRTNSKYLPIAPYVGGLLQPQASGDAR